MTDLSDLNNGLADDGDEDEVIIELTDIVYGDHEPEEDDGIEFVDLIVDEVSGSSEGPTMDQIEAALEKVIEKKYAQKIEPLLFDAVERVVKKEIEAIKKSLFKDIS